MYVIFSARFSIRCCWKKINMSFAFLIDLLVVLPCSIFTRYHLKFKTHPKPNKFNLRSTDAYIEYRHADNSKPNKYDYA